MTTQKTSEQQHATKTMTEEDEDVHSFSAAQGKKRLPPPSYQRQEPMFLMLLEVLIRLASQRTYLGQAG